MPDTRTYYVLCEDNCRFESMTKQQIYDAIAEATGATPTGVDDAFITKIKEKNANKELKFWIGTQAQFIALATKAADTLYILSDDDTEDSIESAIANLQILVNGKAPLSHTHTMSDVAGLGAAAGYGATSLITSGNNDLVTSGAVFNAVKNNRTALTRLLSHEIVVSAVTDYSVTCPDLSEYDIVVIEITIYGDGTVTQVYYGGVENPTNFDVFAQGSNTYRTLQRVFVKAADGTFNSVAKIVADGASANEFKSMSFAANDKTFTWANENMNLHLKLSRSLTTSQGSSTIYVYGMKL